MKISKKKKKVLFLLQLIVIKILHTKETNCFFFESKNKEPNYTRN